MRNDMIDVFLRMEQMRKTLKENGKLGFDGPCYELYNKTSGVVPGKVYTIAAYSNVGKSKFAYWHIAYYLKQKKKVLVINLEVSSHHCLLNILQSVNSMNYNEIMNYNITDDDVEFYDNLIITDELYRLDDIVKKIEEEKPDIVFIDFVQNIQATGGGLYEQSSLIAKTIQRTAIKTNSVIYSLSQLSNSVGRDVSKGNTDFISLKGGGEYFASSDVIFLLSRGDIGEMIVKIVKNKFGPNGGEFVYSVDFSRNQFTFIRKADELC